MNVREHQEYLVTINAPPSLEETLVDCLLDFQAEDGFSSFFVSGHDHRHDGLSLAEQVTGRKKQIRFQMYVLAEGLPLLLAKLKDMFKDSGIHYWVTPVIESGYL